MTALRASFQPPPTDYPNLIAEPLPVQTAFSPRWATILGLFLLCLVPRSLMVWKIGAGICPDAALYIRLAQALEAGDYKLGLYEMHLNTFPAILMLMHRVGLGWEVAGHVWNVVIASLVVLPLYGWIRRQFDHRAAVAGSLLYAVHPKLIEWSPEIIRDPTFWFLFTLSLYLVYRAITEVQLTLFLAAGISMALTWLTRFEGFFLLIPLVLWTFWRFWALRVSRARLLLGAALAVAAFPTLLLMVNLTWLRDYHHFEVSRLKPLNLLLVWLTTLTEGRSPTDAAAGLGGMSVGRIVREFFPVMTRGMSPAFALCTFGGMWGWRRVWARRDHQAIFCMAMAILGGIWIGLWYVHFSCTRYALSIVLLSAGFAALGYRGFTAWLVRTVARLGGGAAAAHCNDHSISHFVRARRHRRSVDELPSANGGDAAWPMGLGGDRAARDRHGP